MSGDDDSSEVLAGHTLVGVFDIALSEIHRHDVDAAGTEQSLETVSDVGGFVFGRLDVGAPPALKAEGTHQIEQNRHLEGRVALQDELLRPAQPTCDALQPPVRVGELESSPLR